MPLKSFVDQARKTNALIENIKVQQTNSENNIVDISEGNEIPKEKLDKIKSQNKSTLSDSFRRGQANSTKTNLTEFEKSYLRKTPRQVIGADPNQMAGKKSPSNSKQIIDDRHGNIIARVIRESGSANNETTSWENCKYLKKDSGAVYCKEFMSLCGKEKCKRATK